MDKNLNQLNNIPAAAGQEAEQNGISGLRARTFAVLFLLLVIPVAVIMDIAFIRYEITGEPDHTTFTTDVGNTFENDFIAGFPGKYTLIDMNGALHKLFGQREINTIVKLDSGKLTELYPPEQEEDLRARADKVAALSEELTKENIPFIYVATPSEVSETDPQLPADDYDFSNQNLDTFLSELDAKGTPYIDLRKDFEADGMDLYDYLYRTDHHWTTEAGFYAYNKIADWMEQEAGIPVDPAIRDINSYSVTTYPKWHLGSRGRRTGKYFTPVDDFDYIEPAFPTSITLERDGTTGTLPEMLYDTSVFDERIYQTRDTYDDLFYKTANHWINNNATNDKTVICVMDSFGFTVAPYILLSVNKMYVVTAYDPSGLKDMIGYVHPDAVILMQFPSLNLDTDASFDFGY